MLVEKDCISLYSGINACFLGFSSWKVLPYGAKEFKSPLKCAHFASWFAPWGKISSTNPGSKVRFPRSITGLTISETHLSRLTMVNYHY